MRKLWSSWGVAVALLLASGALQAQIDKATAESLIRKSGLWEQLGAMSPQVQDGFVAGLDQGGLQPSEAERERLGGVLADAFAPQRLRAVAVGRVARGLKARHLSRLQRWFDSPAGRTIARLEEAATADATDPQTQLREGAALLEQLSPARRALLERLSAETRAAETLTQISINIVLAVQRGVSSAQYNAPGPSLAELRSALEAQREELQQTMSGFVLAGFARAYQSLPDEMLARYVAFYRSEAGAHFNLVSITALDAALTEASAALGRALPGLRDQGRT